MRIWIVNPYDPLPEEGPVRLRYWSLAAALAERGCEVTWWSVDWAHDRKQRRRGSAEQQVGDPPFTVRKLPVPRYRRNVSLARIRSHRAYAREFRKAGKAAIRDGNTPSVIVFSVPPMETGAVALELGRQCGAKVVLDVMDAWPATLVQSLSRKPWLRKLARVAVQPYERAMRRYCREADGVCAQSEAFARYASHQNLTTSATGATDTPSAAGGGPRVFYLGAEPPEAEIKESERTDELRFAYIGSMGLVYDLRTVVEAAIRFVGEEPRFRLVLLGEGAQRKELEDRVREAGCEDVITFTGYLQGNAYEQALAGAAVGIVPMFPDSMVAVPYKAGEYLARGMAVINSLPGELQAALDEAGCGFFYEAGNGESLLAAMQAAAVVENHRPDRSMLQARALFADRFDRRKISAAYADWLIDRETAE